MHRAHTILRNGQFRPEQGADRLLLDFDERSRRRILLTSENGAEILLDLAETTRLRDGDAVLTDEGRAVLVAAKPEPLHEIAAPDAHTLLRIAYHLGNRHLAIQILPRRLRIREDRVIADMARRLGGSARALMAPFDPEGGAYAAADLLAHAHENGHAAHD